MRLLSEKGDFTIVQTVKNKDELLISGSWHDLVKVFDSRRTFLIDKDNSNELYGVLSCKQECSEFLNKLIQEIDYAGDTKEDPFFITNKEV